MKKSLHKPKVKDMYGIDLFPLIIIVKKNEITLISTAFCFAIRFTWTKFIIDPGLKCD